MNICLAPILSAMLPNTILPKIISTPMTAKILAALKADIPMSVACGTMWVIIMTMLKLAQKNIIINSQKFLVLSASLNAEPVG